jgi:DNA-binding GntR family transcriptional regulator
MTVTERNGYQAIAGRLADEVAELEPGTKLASEHELMARFGVGRASARAAVQELERRGLVRRVRGSGTFVNHRIDYVISKDRRPSWHRTVESAGAVPRSTVLQSEVEPVPAHCAHHLGIEPGTEVHHMRRLRFVDDRVAALGEEWVKRDALTDLRPAMRVEESLDELLRQVGRVDVVRSWCRTAMELPSEDIQAVLEMNYVAPVWVVESINRNAATGTAVTYSIAWMRADVIRVVMEIGDTAPVPNEALHR